MDNPFKSPAVLSVCPGIRGLERGIERAVGSVRTIAYVEIETFIVANLLAGMEAGILAPAPIWSNLKTFPWRHFRGKVDILMGGYPCQPFSNAGLGLAELDPRHLWPYIEGGIRTIKPVCCFFENVAAHLNKGYREVKRSLEEMGYVVKEGIYAAEEVGAPHVRERLFILAVANSDCYGYGTGAGQVVGTSSKNESKEHRQEWNDLLRQWMRDVVRNSSKELVDATGKRIGGESGNVSEKDGRQNTGLPFQSNGSGQEMVNAQGVTEREQADETNTQPAEGEAWKESGQRCVFPARPGVQQHSWEEPRTIESGMGCTINGYNFREDLLRALGNSVVEQTAELAFIDLMNKHLKNLKCA